ncbi:MAG: SMC family ATPase [Bacteroidota bacterium]|jgi:DNA repair exonuclease SbcCD ATPase subunit
MRAFNVNEVAKIAQDFIKNDRRLAYTLSGEMIGTGFYQFKAENLFSSMYCFVTSNVETILSWATFQREIYQHSENKINRYLIYLIPEEVVRSNHLYEKLSRAESNEFFFRKVFIDIPTEYDRKIIERSLSRRIPIWMAEREKTLSDFVPLVETLLPNVALRELLLTKKSPAIINEIESNNNLRWLLSENSNQPSKGENDLSSPAGVTRRNLSRVTSLTLKNFRCFKDRQISLDADIIAIYGLNGMGKTTIVDALEFSVFNDIERLQFDPDRISSGRNRFRPLINSESPSAEGAVISLKGISHQTPFEIINAISENKFTTTLNNRVVRSHDVIDLLTGNPELTQKKQYLDILLHTHFLGQHSIRNFIYGDSKKSEDVTRNRYDLIAEMFGLGRIESLRHRVQKVCNDIMQSKIKTASQVERDLRTALKSTQQKYGPKARTRLEERGYKIEVKAAIQAFEELIKELHTRLQLKLDLSIIRCSLPVGNYQKACQTLDIQIKQELQKIKSKDADINDINKLYLKINSFFMHSKIEIKDQSLKAFVDSARLFLQASIKSVENERHAQNVLNVKIKEFTENVDRLRRFQSNYPEFLDLRSREVQERKDLAEARKLSSGLMRQRAKAEARLRQQEQIKDGIEREIQLTEKLSVLLAGLRDQYQNIELKRSTQKKNINRIAVLDKQIVDAERSMDRLSTKEDVRSSANSIRSILDKGDHFLQSGQFICPCCGAPYNSKKELNDKILHNIGEAPHKMELAEFILGLDKIYRREAIGTTRQLLEIKRNERASLEKDNTTIEKDIAKYDRALAGIGGKKILTQEELTALVRENKSKLRDLNAALKRVKIDSLMEVLHKIDKQVSTFDIAAHENRHRETTKKLSDATTEIEGLLSQKALTDLGSISKKIAALNQEIANSKSDLVDRKAELEHTSALFERYEEISKDLTDLEHILIKYEASEKSSINRGSEMLKTSTDTQQRLYDFGTRVADLGVLFGLIGMGEESEGIQFQIESQKKLSDQWNYCYNYLKQLADQLSMVSTTGLKKNLEQYSPLVNEIYKKFTRHEFFSEVQLHPKTTKSQRKRDLFIKLKSYSGETEYTPASYLSEAQLNVLALSIFLTRVIYQNLSMLQTVLIDDPIQQMDNMNATSFIDIIIGLSQASKQIIITTCNPEFFALFCQKMSNLGPQTNITFKSINLELMSDNLEKQSSSMN